jgi:hypothetical protein
MSDNVKILQRQSLLDVAIQTSGSVEAAIALAAANDLSITDELDSGSQLTTVEVVDRRIVQMYAVGDIIRPATALTAEETQLVGDEGIGYWAIGVDFIVS